jgi:hypothetical protein
VSNLYIRDHVIIYPVRMEILLPVRNQIALDE